MQKCACNTSILGMEWLGSVNGKLRSKGRLLKPDWLSTCKHKTLKQDSYIPIIKVICMGGGKETEEDADCILILFLQMVRVVYRIYH